MFEEYEREIEDTRDIEAERERRRKEREDWEEEQADRDYAERGFND